MKTRATLVSLACALILGCGGDSPTSPPEPQPQPGLLRVTLAGGAVGGAVLTVTGTGITGPVASGGALLYHDLAGNSLRAVVVGSSLSGEILRFTVPDVRQVAGYQVTLQELAGTGNQSLSPGSSTAEVSVAP